MNFKCLHICNKAERGAATLLVTVILLALITLVTVYITKLGLLEVKTGANANRAKEALHHAQAGLDYGALMYLDQGSSFAAGAVSVAGTNVIVTGTSSGGIYTITSSGESIDGTGAARVHEGYGRFPIFTLGELPPLMSNGNFPPGGTFSIVANPNGGGTGVPVSAWVASSATVGVGSWQTCNFDEFYYQGNNAAKLQTEPVDGFIRCDACECSAADDTLCEAVNGLQPADCADIVAESAIPDVFENLFRVDAEEWNQYRDSYAVQDIACGDLDADIGDIFKSGGQYAGQLPLIWITGDCNPGGSDIGSPDAPIILVVHGNLELKANTVFFGIAMSFSDRYVETENDNSIENEDWTLKVNGNSTVYGILLSNRNVDLPNGTFDLVYSNGVLENLAPSDGEEEYAIGRRTGSWNDIN
ncbi:MAG: pilus assembly PilX N-terminal domain-containing protein [Neptuniibacter sp.]